MSNQTGPWGRVNRKWGPVRRITAGLLALLCASCSRSDAPERAYQRAKAAYIGGRLQEAVALAAANTAQLRHDPQTIWYWRFRLLQAEGLSQQSRTKEAEALLADPVPVGLESGQLEGRRLVDQAALKSGLEAERLLQRARAIVTDRDLAIRIKLIEGVLARGQRDAGQAALLAALQMADAQGSPYWQAYALNNLCNASKTLRNYEAAIDFGLRALTAAEKAGARRVAALVHVNLGSVYSILGDDEIALDHEQQAARELEAIGDRLNFMIALGELGSMYYRMDDFPKATAKYQESYQIARQLGRNEDAQRNAGNLTLTLIRTRQWDVAAEWNRLAEGLSPLVERADMLPYLNINRARIADGRGQPNDAIRICEDLLRTETRNVSLRWTAYALMGTIDAGANRFQQANPKFENALRIIDGNRAELADSHFRMTLLSRLISFYQDYVSALIRQQDQTGAIRVAESSRARVLTEVLKRNQQPGQFPDAASLQRAARSTHSTLLSFWLAPSRSYAWLITASAVRTFELPPAAEIEKLVTAWRDVVEHPLTDPILTHDPAGPNLWNALMGELGPAIPKGPVIVIPDGALHRLNLETLVVPEPKPHYWIEDVELSVAPSITIAASKSEPPAGDKSLLLIGNPTYQGAEWPPLKNAGKEVGDLADRFAGAAPKVFTGPEAVPAIYKSSEPGRFAMIHFAAHADANSRNPLESAVILSGPNAQNRLYARDVIDIPIKADLVTISACRSAGVRSYAGEGLIGFAWAFLSAGARHVVAGLWDVSDTATEPLMNRFYAGIAAGRNPAGALRDAKLALRRDEPRFAKPYFWGPFQAYVASAAR